MTEQTEDITYEEFVKRQGQTKVKIPIVRAKAVVDVIDKDGNLKSTLNFDSEEVNDADC